MPEPAPPARAGSLQWVGMLAVAVVAVVADQVTKRVIERTTPIGQVHDVLPFLHITHVANTGIAFGFLPGRLGIVSVLTALAVVWMLVHFSRSGSRHVVFPVALGLLVGGSVSNLFDRVVQGRVTDFIQLPHWPTFNLADSFIVVGVGLLLVGIVRLDHSEPPAPPTGGPPPGPPPR
ncbi:MAG TPA: signal peptidase II [Gaiellales bacterium]|nr:signal peptidase II [Gaiellales bacterium]